MQHLELKRGEVSADLFSYKYFPYELRLAVREVERLVGVTPSRTSCGFRFSRSGVDAETLSRLTYFKRLVLADGTVVEPLQAKLEQSAPLDNERRRQATRYSAHGFHEYKGKFNPQIVRAAQNIVALHPDARIWDPFSGSGTSLLEALHGQRTALGTDLNPLAVVIANAKIAALRAAPKTLMSTCEAITSELRRLAPAFEGRSKRKLAALMSELGFQTETLPNLDYLREWFPTRVLAQLAVAFGVIDKSAAPHLRMCFRILSSNVLRDVSWQDPADLRIRRRKDPQDNYPVLSSVAKHMQIQCERAAASRDAVGKPRGRQWAECADSRTKEGLSAEGRRYLEEGVDCVTTSPPYATALPYIDTQRLSLAALGLLSQNEIRQADKALLGSREIGKTMRLELEAELSKGTEMSTEVLNVCRRMLDAVNPETDGFRKVNTPGLVYRYFLGMGEVLSNVRKTLRRGGHALLVVGENRTTLGGTEFAIKTPELLASIGEGQGLECVEILPLDAYQRFSLHRQNAITSERLVILRRP